MTKKKDTVDWFTAVRLKRHVERANLSFIEAMNENRAFVTDNAEIVKQAKANGWRTETKKVTVVYMD